jgi:regulator of sigma E protease
MFFTQMAVTILGLVWLLGVPIYGNLLVAWLLNLPLSEFKIGEGPRIASFTIGVTRYELHAIPLSATSNLDVTQVPARGKLFLWAMSGPMTSLLVGFVLFYGMIVLGRFESFRPGSYITIQKEKTVPGLLDEDVVLAVSGEPIGDGLDLAERLSRWKSGPLEISLERNGELLEVTLERPDDKTLEVAVFCGSARSKHPLNPLEAVAAVPRLFLDCIAGEFWFLWDSIGHPLEPVWQYTVLTSKFANSPDPLANFVLWLGLWNVLLAILSLVPGRLFGGSRILLAIYYLITGKIISERAERVVTTVATVLSVLFIAWLAWRLYAGSGGVPTDFQRARVMNVYWGVEV